MWPHLANALITVSLNNSHFLAGIAQTQVRMLAFTNQVQSQSSQIGNALRSALFIGGAGGAAGGLTGLSLVAAAQAEQGEMALTHFMGSAKAARQLMQELEEFASRTQFDFPGSQDAARKLLNIGLAGREVIPTLETLADAAAGVGKGQEGFNRIVYAMSQIRGSGTLKATEMRQLTEALIPAWEILSKKMGMTVPELKKAITDGAVSAKSAFEMLIQGMEEQYGGMTDKMLNTMGGKWARFKDELYFLFKDIGEIFAPMVKPMLDGLTEMTQYLRSHIQDWGEQSRYFVENWRDILNLWTLEFQKTFAKITAIVEYFGTFWDQFVGYLVTMFTTAFTYLQDFVSTFFHNMMAYGEEWVEQFGNSISKLFDDLRHGRMPNPAFEEFKPDTEDMPKWFKPEFPQGLQKILAGIDGAFDGAGKNLEDRLAAAWDKIINPEGADLAEHEGRAIEEGLPGKKGKGRQAEFIGLEELSKKHQLQGLEDPVVKAINQANDNQVAALGQIKGALDNIDNNTQDGLGVKLT
jgi:tape measure domain-containing protein